MPPRCIQRIWRCGGRIHLDLYLALDASRNGHGPLPNDDAQGVCIPDQATSTNLEPMQRPAEVSLPTLGHGPSVAAPPVQRDIQRSVVLGLCRTAAARDSVVRREHAADKGNDGQAVLAIMAECIDVPPDVAARLQRDVEVWSAR